MDIWELGLCKPLLWPASSGDPVSSVACRYGLQMLLELKLLHPYPDPSVSLISELEHCSVDLFLQHLCGWASDRAEQQMLNEAIAKAIPMITFIGPFCAGLAVWQLFLVDGMRNGCLGCGSMHLALR